MFETVLLIRDLDLESVSKLYQDYPNVQVTVKVEKKERFKTDPEDERILLQP